MKISRGGIFCFDLTVTPAEPRGTRGESRDP